MAGTSGSILFGDNIDFTGSYPVSGMININGELLVGSAVAPNIHAYVPTGSNGLVVNTGPGTIDFTLANIPNSAIANHSITVTTGTGLTGGGIIPFGSASTISLTTPVVVANGGTGVSTFANTSALITTGTTATGAVQNVASVATGQVLTSAGTSTLPAWSATPTVTSITFGAGNALNTYTVGTFTPTAVGGSSAGTTTYSEQDGYFTQIGNLMHILCFVNASAATGTGDLTIGGFPATVKNQTRGNFMGAITISGLAAPAGTLSIAGQAQINTTTAVVNCFKGASNVQISNVGFNFFLSMFYQV